MPDFPKPGILFRDLTPLMGDGAALREAIDLLAESVARHRPELVVAIESRGFIFGAPVAASLGIGFVPVRKPGKLPPQDPAPQLRARVRHRRARDARGRVRRRARAS